MKLNNGLKALTTPEELNEVSQVLVGSPLKAPSKPVRLQYLRRSGQLGLRLWNVLEPKLEGYTYGPDSGVPTLSLQGLKDKGVI